MSINGVFAVSRSIWVDPDFRDEPFTERLAMIWLISEASWKGRKARGQRGLVTLGRGEFCHSIRFMASAWGWDRCRADRFIQTLKKRDIIRDASRDGAKIYSLKNYNKFQVVGLPQQDNERDTEREADETRMRHERDTDRDKLEEGNKVIRELPLPKGRGAVPAQTTSQWIYAKGKELLALATKPPKDPGGLISKWLRDFGEDEIMRALRLAETKRSPEPVALIEGLLRKSPRHQGRMEENPSFGGITIRDL